MIRDKKRKDKSVEFLFGIFFWWQVITWIYSDFSENVVSVVDCKAK